MVFSLSPYYWVLCCNVVCLMSVVKEVSDSWVLQRWSEKLRALFVTLLAVICLSLWMPWFSQGLLEKWRGIEFLGNLCRAGLTRSSNEDLITTQPWLKSWSQFIIIWPLALASKTCNAYHVPHVFTNTQTHTLTRRVPHSGGVTQIVVAQSAITHKHVSHTLFYISQAKSMQPGKQEKAREHANMWALVSQNH